MRRSVDAHFLCISRAIPIKSNFCLKTIPLNSLLRSSTSCDLTLLFEITPVETAY